MGLTTQNSVYKLQVQFEDLDAVGVVYHPNYLNFFERGRSDALRQMGLSFKEILKKDIGIVIADLQMRFLRPAKHDDWLWVLTRLVSPSRSSFIMEQVIIGSEPTAADIQMSPEQFAAHPSAFVPMRMRLVCVDLKTLKPCEIPEDVRNSF